jgi:hypothetical protein
MTTPIPREALAAVGYRFSQANGERIQLAEFDAILLHRLTGADPDELARATRESIAGNGADSAYRQAAYFALAKKSDDDLLPFFRERLRTELESGETDACYQLLLALDELGEDAFSTPRDVAIAGNRESSLRDAIAYLDSLG